MPSILEAELHRPIAGRDAGDPSARPCAEHMDPLPQHQTAGQTLDGPGVEIHSGQGQHEGGPRDLEVEFHSQAGVKFTYWSSEFTGEDADPQLELAYALTVHKTQGSQFGRTFVVVPRILHYRRMIVALEETGKVMAEIDRVIDQHGGWPDAFRGMAD